MSSVVYNQNGYNPGGFQVNRDKLKKLRPELFRLKSLFTEYDTRAFTEKQLLEGDVQPAVVISTDPLLVACYSADIDAVVLLCLPTELGKHRDYFLDTRLITVNCYNLAGKVHRDIYPGPNCAKGFKTYGPIIADLYTDDIERLESFKEQISEEMWEYVTRLGNEYMYSHPGVARNGLGFRFAESQPIYKIKFNPKVIID